jgi:hypothetical protein
MPDDLTTTEPHTTTVRHGRDALFRAWQAVALRAPDAATAAEDAAALGLLMPLAGSRAVPVRLLGVSDRRAQGRGKP